MNDSCSLRSDVNEPHLSDYNIIARRAGNTICY